MLKIIYAGTPEFAVPALQGLIDSNHRVVTVCTQPDRPAGRGRKLQASPVKQCAERHGIPVMQPVSFKSSVDIDALAAFEPDLMVVAAYGLILPQSVLDIPRLGCINIHASLLPRWRGAAPIQRAILAGDEITGITLMQMDVGLDTGDMLAVADMPIPENMVAADLHDRLKVLGANLLMENLDAIADGELQPVLQDNGMACYASKLTKQEASVDWSKSARQLSREIRAFNPWPVSFTSLDQKPVKIWSADVKSTTTTATPGQVLAHSVDSIDVGCGSDVLAIKELQFAGKQRTSAQQVLNARDLTGLSFGD